MKKIISSSLIIGLVFVFIPFVYVNADNGEDHSDNNSTSTTSTNLEDNSKKYEIEDTTKAEYKQQLEQRLKERKAAAITKLQAAKEKNIKTKCKASQSLINKLSEKASATKSSRDEIYNNMTKNATKLSDRLKESGQDTASLDKNIEELNVLIDKFKTDLKEMRQIAQDLSAMDCASDPTGFAITLESLRTSRNDVKQDSEAIRFYIKDNLKPTLQAIRTSIGEQKQQEGAN